MDLIGWLLRLVLFVLVLWFALQNMDPVPLHFTASQGRNDVPLVVVILACFIAGALAGILALVPHLLRQRKRIAVLTRSVSERTVVAPEVATESLTDVARRVGAVGGLEAETRTRR